MTLPVELDSLFAPRVEADPSVLGLGPTDAVGAAPSALAVDTPTPVVGDTQTEPEAPAELDADTVREVERRFREEKFPGIAETWAKAVSGDPEAYAALSSHERRALRPVLDAAQARQEAEALRAERARAERDYALHDEFQERELADRYGFADWLSTQDDATRAWWAEVKAHKARSGLSETATSADLRHLDELARTRALQARAQEAAAGLDPDEVFDEIAADADTKKHLGKDDLAAIAAAGRGLPPAKATKAMHREWSRRLAAAEAKAQAAPVAAEAARVNARAERARQAADGAGEALSGGGARAGDALTRRHELAAKWEDGTLTPAERQEWHGLANAGQTSGDGIRRFLGS